MIRTSTQTKAKVRNLSAGENHGRVEGWNGNQSAVQGEAPMGDPEWKAE